MMRALFLTGVFLSAAVACAAEADFELKTAILNAYADPRVAAIVETAIKEQRSVVVDLKSDDTSFELSAEPAAAPAAITHFGAMLDVGAPDGAGLNFVYRPWKWLRAHVGGTYNGVSGGIRGGVTLLPPFYFPILPTATIEAGHAFEGDANWIARLASGDQTLDNPSLKRVSYDYVNGHLGLEIGSQNRFVFYIHGGFTYLHSTIHDFQQTVNQPNLTAKDPNVSVIVPSGKLGFLVYFW